jgi:hypothetical protein
VNRSLVDFWCVNGSPRYFIGSYNGWYSTKDEIVMVYPSEMVMGTNLLLCMLMWRPVASVKVINMFVMMERLFGCAGVKMIVSFANCNSSVCPSGVCIRCYWLSFMRFWGVFHCEDK